MLKSVKNYEFSGKERSEKKKKDKILHFFFN